MVLQYRAVWSVPGGGEGYSTFHANFPPTEPDAQVWADKVRAFFDAIKLLIPSNVSIAFEGEVVELNTASGQLVDVLPVTPPAAVTGTGTGQYAAGAGARVDWRTAGIRNGRRVTGRTYIVPLIGTQFEANGTLVANAITVMENAAQGYLTGGTVATNLVVYSRPSTAGPGAVHAITGGVVPDKSALMRSRRD